MTTAAITGSGPAFQADSPAGSPLARLTALGLTLPPPARPPAREL